MSFLGKIFHSRKKESLEKFDFQEHDKKDNLTESSINNSSLDNMNLGLEENKGLQQNTFNENAMQSNPNFESIKSFNEFNQRNLNQQKFQNPELMQIQKELEVISSKIETLKVLLENINQRLYVLENQNARRY